MHYCSLYKQMQTLLVATGVNLQQQVHFLQQKLYHHKNQTIYRIISEFVITCLTLLVSHLLLQIHYLSIPVAGLTSCLLSGILLQV